VPSVHPLGLGRDPAGEREVEQRLAALELNLQVRRRRPERQLKRPPRGLLGHVELALRRRLPRHLAVPAGVLAAQRDDEDVEPRRVRQAPHPGAQLDGEQLGRQRLARHLDEVRRPQPCEQVLVGAGPIGHADELIRCDEHVLPHQVGEDHRIRTGPVEAHRQ